LTFFNFPGYKLLVASIIFL